VINTSRRWPSIGCGAAAAIVLSAAGCGSSSAASSSAAANASLVQTSAARNVRPIANVCDGKIITPEDLVSVLPGASNGKALDGDPQTCEYEAPDAGRVSITVRPGLGDVTVGSWVSSKVAVASVGVNGIGDRAIWQRTLRELVATKHNVLCDISAEAIKGSDADLQAKFGQLCAKIWAAE
jgi:hypothetical protein